MTGWAFKKAPKEQAVLSNHKIEIQIAGSTQIKMLTQNFGAAASLQATFGAQQAHQCGLQAPQPQPYPGVPSYPGIGYPQAMPQQQQQVSAQFQMQMMMSYYMTMMSSMSQLQQGFGSFLGQGQQQLGKLYQLPTGGGYGGVGGGGSYGGGGGGGYATPTPTPIIAPKPAPAPAPPAKKGGYA